MFQSGVDNHSYLGREGHTSHTEIDLFTQECAGRRALEHYISRKYLQVHDAHVNECLPILVGIRDRAERLGAFGLRPGHYRPHVSRAVSGYSDRAAGGVNFKASD